MPAECRRDGGDGARRGRDTEESVISTSRIIKPRVAALCLAAVLAIGAGGHAIAQSDSQGPDDSASDAGAIDTPLNLPNDVAVFGKFDPTIRKATAIVNGFIITDTDVDQRLNLVLAANGQQVGADERDRLRLQVLRNLIDEALEIQEAKSNDVTIRQRRYRHDLRARRRPVQIYARAILDFPEIQGRVAGDDASPDRGRARLAAAARSQGPAVHQRRRRRGEAGHRPAQRVEGHQGISRRRDLPLLDAVDRRAGPRQRRQDHGPDPQGWQLRRLCAAIFGSLDGRRRRRSGLGARRAVARCDRADAAARCRPARSLRRSPCPAAIRSSRCRMCARCSPPIRAMRCSASSRSR